MTAYRGGVRDRAEAAPGGRPPIYLDVPFSVARLKANEPASGDDAQDRGRAERAPLDFKLSDPVLYVAGGPVPDHCPFDKQRYATPPTIGILAAEYGMGKSELFAMLERYINANAPLLRDRRALRVELGHHVPSTRRPLLARVAGEDDEAARRFAELLFGTQTDDEYEERRARIRSGKTILLLDALDELLPQGDQTDYERFFDGLANYAGGQSEPEPGFLILVSMRREFLVTVDDEAAGLIGRTVRGRCAAKRLTTDLLQLAPFTLDLIRVYLERHFEGPETPSEGLDVESLMARIEADERLVEILSRPLLLRLWCEMVSGIGSLPDISRTADLIESYIKFASKEQHKVHGGGWDLDKLSEKALNLFSNAEIEIPDEDIDELVTVKPGAGSPEERQATLEAAIHKCPFLQQTNEGVCFAHRAFFEYFTVQGVKLHALRQPRDVKPFNDLVLNTDMRKLLKAYLGEKMFISLAHEAWGLDDSSWASSEQDREDFERWHSRLLASMTIDWHEPGEAKKLREAVVGLLARIRDGAEVHPNYLMYGLDSIGVHLLRETNANIRDQRKPFSDVVKDTAERVVARLKDIKEKPDAGDQASANRPFQGEDYELLLEKVLDLGTRLHMPWVIPYCTRRVEDISDYVITNEQTKRRVTRIMERVTQPR